MASVHSAAILQIPSEITEHALIYADPEDVASFARTCRIAHSLVYEARDQHLWRSLFLNQGFDDPRVSLDVAPSASSSVKEIPVDWRGALQWRVKAARIVRNLENVEPHERKRALQILISLIMNAPAASSTTVDQKSKSLAWLSQVVEGLDILSLPKVIEETDVKEVFDSSQGSEETQLLAQLRTYVGLSEADKRGAPAIRMRTAARCFVYDLRNYMEENSWGPFLPDKGDRVNWKHVEAIIAVLSLNLRDLRTTWPVSRPPVGLEATRAYSAPGVHDRDPRDWAGVEGIWRRYVCFMDYRDLFAFNFSTAHNGPYDPSFFTRGDFQEAIRLIELRLHVTRVAENICPSCASASSSPPTTPTSSSSLTSPISIQPDIHFSGTSRSGNGGEARVRGTVSMTSDGHVRWRFVSMHDGHHHWSAEGVQIGNVACAAGIVGAWTGAHHEDGDPAGPFWLWKVDEDHPRYIDEED